MIPMDEGSTLMLQQELIEVLGHTGVRLSVCIELCDKNVNG